QAEDRIRDRNVTGVQTCALPILVGYGSGKTGFVKREYTQAFADFVVKIALPFAFFLAAAQSSPKVLLNIDYMLALAVGLIVAYRSEERRVGNESGSGRWKLT